MDDYGDEVRLKNTLEPRGACDPTSKNVTKIARSQCMLRCCAFCACSCSCHCTCC